MPPTISDRCPLDAALHGGLRRGHLSEIVGGMSSRRTTLMSGMVEIGRAHV